MTEIENKVDRVRRGLTAGAALLFTGVGGYVFSKVADAFIGDDLAEGVKPFKKKLFYHFDPNREIMEQKDPTTAENTKLLAKIIGYDSTHTLKLAGGSDHYLYSGMHHDTQWARDTIFGVFRGFVPELELVTGGNPTADEHIVCLGSPTTNLRSAVFMEYEHAEVGQPKLGFRRVSNPLLSLPFTYELDTRLLVQQGRVASGGIDRDPTPEWALRINGALLPTKSGETDYLLISRLPNFLNAGTRSNLENSPVALVIGGCTGAATGAMHLLVKEGEILRELAQKTDAHPYWQAVIAIDKIESRWHPIKHENRFQAVALNKHVVAWEKVAFN